MEYQSQADYNSNIDAQSLSRSLSAPRRCNYCQKIMFFKTYRCKHCRYRCHKKCAGHSHSKSRGCHRSLSGEEHWTKVLQANEVNSNLVVVPCHLSRSGPNYPTYQPPPTTTPPEGGGGGGGMGGGGGGGAGEPSNKSRHPSATTMTTTTTTAASSPKCAKSFSSSSSYQHASNARHAKDSVPGSNVSSTHTMMNNSTKDSNSNIFINLYDRLCRWMNAAGIASTSRGDESRCGSRSRTPRTPRSLSRSSSIASTKSQDLYQLLSNMPEEYHNSCIHASISSEESEFSSFHQAGYSSTCSSSTITSTSTTCSGDWHVQTSNTDSSFPPSAISTGYFPASSPTKIAKPKKDRTQFYSVGSKTGVQHLQAPHTNLTFTISCPLKTRRPSVSGQAEQRDRSSLCATWPPTGRKTYVNEEDQDEEEEEEVLDDAVFGDPDEPKSWEQREAELKESLREFSISWRAIEKGECLRVGRSTQIYKGKWHGDVMVHTFPNVEEPDLNKFWEEVSKLSMIRHENVALFMGACIELPDLAVITSVRRGASLYEQVHITREKMSLHTRVHIVRQIAQGMGYLHAKGVVMSKLNSKNIYLEPKVKLCLVDYSMAEKVYERPGYGYVPRGHLTYVAPELLRTLAVVSPRLVPTSPYTTETDVFAFGTVMYELMTGQFPFRRMATEVLIWQVCRGYRQSLKHLKYSSSLKSVIAQCWAHDPATRPTFSDINKHFQFNGALHKRHSSSEPERLNMSGLASKNALL